ncbi:hypothetical protein K491DRAFT_763598 [Lophiostoma macrostomum CBS 122681]|uniref:Uncharacterized protein n=1 Tax=Lophiostoma macrostomum CBS 122681 TaxID=1314788 RepID=A0A6A6SJM1_9PLEO|nr:hypothetical protein K491DRAFT_763598 [Lophiostoma macrostomum CBS 122681]
MAPPKKKLSHEQYRSLVDSYDIQFLGPVPPRDWPREHNRLFEVIRKIGTLRYEDFFKERRNDNPTVLETVRDTVRKLRARAFEIRKDTGINEAEWRDKVEHLVLGRLSVSENVVCHACGHEVWTALFEALPLNDNAKSELKDKRKGRSHCEPSECRKRAVKFANKDDEKGPVFDSHVSRPMFHGPEDANLGSLTISMAPDRIIGLGATRDLCTQALSTEHLLTHSLVAKMRALYPFLLVEAKKERNSPGFRAIEMQTAFPVRRLLQIQNNLRKASGIDCEFPLVWFFAYQGDDWRLYAGTLDSKGVRMYELWRGTIESQDSALQILQIVDYIWSWARDVYRPQIRACLSKLIIRTNSELIHSTDNFRYTPSIASESAPSRYSQRLDEVENFNISEDEDGENGDGDGESNTRDDEDGETRIGNETGDSTEPTALDYGQEDDTMTDRITSDMIDWIAGPVRTADMHYFLRWGPDGADSPSWTKSACIRHSNLVSFSFVRIQASSRERTLRDSTIGNRQHFSTTDNDLQKLEEYWTGRTPKTKRNDGVISVSLFFRTYMEPDWQITRQICCVEWGTLQSQPNIRSQDLLKSFQDLQHLRGSVSVLCALQDYTLVASTQSQVDCNDLSISWEVPNRTSMSEPQILGHIKARQNQDPQILDHIRLIPSARDHLWTPHPLPGLPPALMDGKSLLVKRPLLWPETSPQFCVFAFKSSSLEEHANLAGLLDEAIAQDNIFIDGEENLSEEDWRNLREWLVVLKQMTNLAPIG